MISLEDILKFPKRYRTQLINSVSGFKSCNLISTINTEKKTNVAIFSSVTHLGSNPPLLGFIHRPDTVEKHTLENIRATEKYVINQVHSGIAKQAHQTSARYDRNTSEFEATGLTPEYWDFFPVPYVKESLISIAMEMKEIIPIAINGTYLVIGEIQYIRIPETLIEADGKINLEQANTVTLSGLDNYHQTESLFRLSYAKTDKEVEEV